MQNETITILQIVPTLISGGVERGAVDIAIGLKEQGFNSIIASGGGPLVSSVERYGIKHVMMPLSSKNPLIMAFNSLRLAGLIRSEKVNVIHARSRAPAWSAFLAHKITGCRFITTFHGDYSFKPIKVLKKYYNSIMVKGSKVIAVSKFIEDQIEKNYAVSGDKIVTIHRGVDLNEFCPKKVISQRLLALRNKISIPDGKLVITMPGRITKGKGHEVLLNALSLLNKNDFCCLIVGDIEKHHNYYLEISELVDKLGLKDNIVFTGNLPDMPAVYLLSDIIVAPSTIQESFGRIAVEAQAMGRIVIASNLGGFKETIRDGETGFLIPPNSEALAEAISRVTNMTEHNKYKIMQSARKNAELFSLEKMKRKTVSIYKELVVL
jgi:glycosyltransferase involved in cell wall biosynthesis